MWDNEYQKAQIPLKNKAAWICSKCESIEYLKEGVLILEKKESEIASIPPRHCNLPMNLGIIPYYEAKNKHNQDRDELVQLLKKQEYVTAGEIFLRYILRLFGGLHFQNMKMDFIKFTRDSSDEFLQTDRYKLAHLFISVFYEKNMEYSFNLIHISIIGNLNFRQINPRWRQVLLHRIIDIKQLILNYIQIYSSQLLIEYYPLLWKIEQIIDTTKQQRNLPDVGEFKIARKFYVDRFKSTPAEIEAEL